MAESLPQELIDAIINEVHSPSDLRACSLTSRAFSSSTRAILFCHIKLKGSQLNSDGVQKLHELCVAFPHIPPLVQTLCVNGHRGSSTFLAVFDIISCILRFMQNLKVLKLDHVTIGNFCDESLARLSTHAFREIHLINVIFHENGFEQLCAVLQRSPGLERLLVHHTHSVSMIGDGTTTHLKLNHLPSTHRRPRIRELSVVSRHLYSFIETVLEMRTCPVSIEELRSFEFTLYKAADVQHLARILKLTLSSLRVLLLNVAAQSSFLLGGLPLFRIGHLREITFTVPSPTYGLQYLHWWIQCLRGIIQSNQSPALQVMVIGLGISRECWDPASPEWSEFDQILSSPPFDERFRMLTIKIQKRLTVKSSWKENASRQSLSQRTQSALYEESDEDVVRKFEARFLRLVGRITISVKEYRR